MSNNNNNNNNNTTASATASRAATTATGTAGGGNNNNNHVSSSERITIRVLVAGTGVTHKLSLHPSELTVSIIRSHLAAAVPPSDQILLLGPPYKVPKDSTFQSDEILHALRLGDMEDDPLQHQQHQQQSHIPQQSQQHPHSQQTQQQHTTSSTKILSSTERSGARRLFLFSRQALSETAPDPTPCNLQPMDLTLPTEAPGPSPLHLDPASSPPLHQALAAYERQFMIYLCQGRVLADGADLRLQACRQCVLEQAVMARALRAAVSNLADHYHGAARTRAEFTALFQAKSAAQASLLQRFDSILASLQNIHLHPSLVNTARASGRAMETLLDTVPVERERLWAQQCLTSHERLLHLFAELDAAFTDIGTPASREEEGRLDRDQEADIENLWAQVETNARQINERQAQRLGILTHNHGQVVKIIMQAIHSQDEDDVQSAFTPLREMSNSSKLIIPSMIADDTVLKQLMQTIADAKTRAMKRMKVRLREVSVAQSSIQRVLSSVGVLRDALAQQSDNMVHLEHVAELPTAYRDFLSELRRRRAYGLAVTSSCTAMMERLALLRADEVKAREKFLRGPGRHLMPAFFEIFVPTLATPPPLYTPQLPAMLELDTLPDVGSCGDDPDITTTTNNNNTSDAMMQGTSGGGAAAGADHGVNSASTLTAESQTQQQQQHAAAAAIVDNDQMVSSAAGGGDQQQQQQQQQNQQQQQQDQLIVSASEQSGNDDLIVDPAAGAAAADAQVKTLAYENAVLRQALERLGAKPPRTYIEEARAKDGATTTRTTANVNAKPMEETTMTNEAQVVVAALRIELSDAKAQARSAQEELALVMASRNKADDTSSNKKQLSDKISHSSFEIGDVGLFMPTGRGSGGKRTYLAFHTNCPHRYLSTDCIKGTPDFVLGRIVYQEELVAGEAGTDANPYGLYVGTKFWVLTVEVLNPPLHH